MLPGRNAVTQIKIEGLKRLIFGCEGTALTKEEAAFFQHAQPFGFILFGRNIESREQLRAFVQDLRTAVGWNAPVLIDQEGGRVQRMAPPVWDQFPPAAFFASHEKSDRIFWLRGRLIADQLMDVGIDVNCAPLLDVARPQTHPFLANRCYGADVDTVRKNAKAMADGQTHGGVASVMKHVPGHGLSVADSHKNLPTVEIPKAELSDIDFAAFVDFDVSMGMTAHIVFKDMDASAPATQSPVMIEFIRKEIGFKGLLMTDDLSMNALTGTVSDRAAKSIDAGCDIGLHCNGDFDEMQQLNDRIGRIEGPAVLRASTALKARSNPQDIDIAALKAEFRTLTSG